MGISITNINSKEEIKETIPNTIILNLTGRKATQDQINDGVINPDEETIDKISKLSNFTGEISIEDVKKRAEAIAMTASLLAKEKNISKALIGGALYLMPQLEKELFARGITPVYSFTKRVSEEEINENGETIKTNVFKHAGFVTANPTALSYDTKNVTQGPRNENIINLTQHPVSKEQEKENVVEPENKDKIKNALTFDESPSTAEIRLRVEEIVKETIKSGSTRAMIGGASYFMPYLEDALLQNHIMPMYSFTERQMQEVVKNGTVEKTNVFLHKNFIKITERTKPNIVKEIQKDEMPTTNTKPIQEEIDKKREEMRKELSQMPTSGTNFSKDEGIKF